MASILDIQNNVPKLQYYHVFSSCNHFIGYNNHFLYRVHYLCGKHERQRAINKEERTVIVGKTDTIAEVHFPQSTGNGAG